MRTPAPPTAPVTRAARPRSLASAAALACAALLGAPACVLRTTGTGGSDADAGDAVRDADGLERDEAARRDDGRRADEAGVDGDGDGREADAGPEAEPDAGPEADDGAVDDGRSCDPGGADDHCALGTLWLCGPDGVWHPVDCAFGCAEGEARCREVVPTNVTDASLMHAGSATFVVPPGATLLLFNTDDGSIRAWAGIAELSPLRPAGAGLVAGIGFTAQPQPDAAPELGVWSFAGFDLAAGVTAIGTGSRAMVLLSSGDVHLDGFLNAGASQPGWSDTPGPGGSPGGPASGAAGGIGAGGGVLGGRGGHGAGAVQITSLTGITIGATGGIAAGGGGGGGGTGFDGADGAGGGGGSGGSVLLEAAWITVDGGVAANGGGGGAGAGDPGVWGAPGASAGFAATSAGGGVATDNGTSGGAGGAGAAPGGQPGGSDSDKDNGGGGGGGAGRLRLNGLVVSVTPGTGWLSPTEATGLATTGRPEFR